MSETENSENNNQLSDKNVLKQKDQKSQDSTSDNAVIDTEQKKRLAVYEQGVKYSTELEGKVREILEQQNYRLTATELERLKRRFENDINNIFFQNKYLASVPLALYESSQSLDKFASLISEALVNRNAQDKSVLDLKGQGKLKAVAQDLRIRAYKGQLKYDYAKTFEFSQNESHNWLVMDTRGQDTHKLALGKNKQFELYRDDHHQGGFSLRFSQGKFYVQALAEAIMLEAGYRPHGTFKNLSNDQLTGVLDQLTENGVDISRLKVEDSAEQRTILKDRQIKQSEFQKEVIEQIMREGTSKDHGVEKLTYPAYMLKLEAERQLHGKHLPQPVIEKFMQELIKEINRKPPS